MSHQVWFTQPKVSDYGVTMNQLIRTRPVSGDIGIEIECEGNKFQKVELPAEWVYHKDGSLRGEDNAEYVFKKPLKFNQVPNAIKKLWTMFEAYGTVLDVSNRTSVHVHLNMQKFHMNRLCAFVSIYFAVEEILTEWCGDHRVGNLFCLRGRDATAIVTQLKKFIMSDGRYEIREGMHYAGLNAQALYKFGSIEIRTMRGVSDQQTILDWVAILQRIYELSKDYPDPRVIPGLLSSEGPSAFLDMVLGDKASIVRSQINFTPERIRDALYDGIRLAQDLCYCRDWSLYEESVTSDDPFGRPVSDPIGMAVAAQNMNVYFSPGTMAVQPHQTFDPFHPTWAPSTHQETQEVYVGNEDDFEVEYEDESDNETSSYDEEDE